MPYFEDLNSILTRYQHHVAEYDKAKWELTVEQRIIHGINHIPTKSAKPQYELIDLDLVRGSVFPKAKPKHGLFKVTKQALLRFLFLPLYHEWWTEQTSPTLFHCFVGLYVAQIFIVIVHLSLFPCWVLDVFQNGTAYAWNCTNSQNPVISKPFGPSTNPVPETGDIVITDIQTSEILSPIFLMIVLTILHSQIVATYGSKSDDPDNWRSSKELRQRSNSGSTSQSKHRKKRTSRHNQRRRSLNPKTKANAAQMLATAGVSCSSQEAPSQNRRVFFQDESKSWTSSNSDKDEGIVDGHENIESGENETEGDVSRLTHDDLQNIVERNIIEANLNATIKKFAEEEELAIRRQNEVAPFQTKEDVEQKSNHLHVIYKPRSRKRNVSKASEVGTSCADCSSNNNESTTEDEYREATMEDEEMRSKSEWTAVTTNSEDDFEEDENLHSEDEEEPTENQLHDHPFAWEFQKHSSKAISTSCTASDKISCTIWDGLSPMKADLTVLDISSSIIAKVERAKENTDYIYLGIIFSAMIAFLPGLWRLNNGLEIDDFQVAKVPLYLKDAFACVFGSNTKFRLLTVISIAERLCLSLLVFFLLAVAEKTYKQRFLYAKLFSRLTSSRKARKSGIPHFRLNKVRNIKIWLSIRSYLQRRGPQRSVDTIVSGTFITTLFLIFFLSVELLKDSNRMYYLYNLEVIGWSMCLGFYLMRFMTLGSKISQKYRNLSVIITEQLNLYLKMELKPHKKDELLVANNVLKLASELLKELEDPFKISSFASNPYLYNVTRLVILSAFSGVLSEMLGFKLKLYKIKLK